MISTGGQYGIKVPRKRSKFTKSEDAILIKLVHELGLNSWDAISQRLPNRNPRQCRERYVNYLAPDLSHEQFTREEDMLLREKLKEYGKRWVQIAKFFPSRTDTMLKNRWLVLSRRDPDIKHTTSRTSGQNQRIERVNEFPGLHCSNNSCFTPSDGNAVACDAVSERECSTELKDVVGSSPKFNIPSIYNFGLFDFRGSPYITLL